MSGLKSSGCARRFPDREVKIRLLQRAGIPTVSAEALLERMLNKIDELCVERDRLKKEQGPVKRRVIGGRKW